MDNLHLQLRVLAELYGASSSEPRLVQPAAGGQFTLKSGGKGREGPEGEREAIA